MANLAEYADTRSGIIAAMGVKMLFSRSSFVILKR